MIKTRKSFKKLLAVSIVTLQITSLAPIYTVLASDVPTSVEDSISKDNEIDEKTKESVKIANGTVQKFKDRLEEYYSDLEDKKEILNLNEEKLLKIKLDLKSDNIKLKERHTLQEQLNNIKSHNKKLKCDIKEIRLKIYNEKAKAAPSTQYTK